MLATSVDWGAVGSIGGLALAVVVGAARILIVIGRLSERLDENTKQLQSNTRHVQSNMSTQWQIIWRVTTVEDYLEQTQGYRPPRIVPMGDREKEGEE